jgi:transcriptional regulator with XRE-family HTH domain
MEAYPDPTVQRHRLRLELRSAREKAGLARRQAAANLGWSESKLVRIEAGQVGLSRTDLKALLDLYGLRAPEAFADLAELAEQSRRQPWKAYRDVLNAEFIVYLGYESAASRLYSFQPKVIHGLLQSEDYARSINQAMAMAPANGPRERIDRQIKARKERQALLHKEGAPQTAFILDETAVRRPPGADRHSREVLRAQLQQLKELATLPTVTIQILPIQYGFHPGSRGPFAVLEFPGDDGSVAYLEGSHSRSVIHEEAEQVRLYRRLFDQLAAAATRPEELDRYLDEVVP